MTKIKFVIVIMLFISLFIPAYSSIAQTTTTEDTQQTSVTVEDNSTQTQDKVDSKKDKDKDLISLNGKFFWCLLINIATLIIMLVFIYYPNTRQLETIFTFFMFNLMIFFLTFVLNKVKISMGAAFGLFAVFSMLRYRTEGISMKDMTYLFIFIAIGLISAIRLEYYGLGIINGLIIVFTFILDSKIIFKHEYSEKIEYENIDLIRPEMNEQLLEDLKKRTGLNIHRIEIGKIDFLRDSASISIYYFN